MFQAAAAPQIALGMTSIFLLFMGQFALFTYLRPFLESVSGYSVSALSLALLLMGLRVSRAPGASAVLRTRLYSIVIAIPGDGRDRDPADAIVMQVPTALLLIAWGFFGTAAPVGWGTWLSRVLRDDAEAGGGLQVAVIQLAITVGAAIGGLLFDWTGWWSSFSGDCCGIVAGRAAAWRWELKLESRSFGRRALLGAVLVGTVMPHSAGSNRAAQHD